MALAGLTGRDGRGLFFGHAYTGTTLAGTELCRAQASASGGVAHGAPLPELPSVPLRRMPDGTAELELVARPAMVTPGGLQARLLTYNGQFPGPLMRVREGERLRVHLVNGLDEPTNLHFHGLHIDPAVDNPFVHVPPGERAVYEFEIPRGSAGTYWYHPHVHGRVARQLFAGLAGPIVVEGPLDAEAELAGADDRLLVLKDLSVSGGEPSPHRPTDWADGKEGDLVLVNGALVPVLQARSPRVRLRLLNASNARFYRLRLDGHPLYLIATDGGLLERPVELAELLLVPGERAEVLVALERPGDFGLWNLPYSRGGLPGISQPQRLLTLAVPADVVTRKAGDPPAALPSRLVTVSPLEGRVRAVRQVVFGMFLINGRPFDPGRADFVGRLGDVEAWEIRSVGDMDHPFHLHTYPFQVAARNGVPEPYRAWRDTVNLRPAERVRILVPLSSFTGRTVFHCHIVEHADRGMMATLEVR